MLQSIRDRAQGLVAGVIVLLLCLTFALWGIQQYLDSGHTVAVAKVDGEEVTLQEYQTSFQRLRQRAQAELGQAFDAKQWAQESTKSKALDFLVEQKLLEHVVEKGRIRVSDQQVLGQLMQAPQFQVDGKFSKERYAQVLSMLGFKERGFEQQAREDMAIQQLRAGVAMSAFVTESEAQQLAQLREETRDVGYAVLPMEPFKAKVELKPDEVRKYFDEHQEQYRTDEKVTLQYLELSRDALMPQVQVDDEKLKAYYDTHTAKYTVEEQRNVNHILVKLKKGASAEEEKAAFEKAQAIRARVSGGEAFEEVAKKESDDVGSRADGGETGPFGKGVMAPEFEAAAFALKQGEISEPVKTQFGYHVIRVKEIKPGGVKPFAEVRADVETAFRTEQADTLYAEHVEQFNNAVYEHPDSLDNAAGALNLQVQTAGPLTRGEIAEKFAPSAIDAVFEGEVLTQGMNSTPVEVSETRTVAFRVTAHEVSRLRKLDEVETEVEATLRDQHARELAAARGNELLERMKKGEDPKAVIAGDKLEWKEAKGAGRESAEVNRAVLRAAFRAKAPDASAPSYAGIALGTGDFAVMQITNRQLPPAEKIAGSKVEQQRKALMQDRAMLGWKDYVTALKESAKVETHVDRL
ncbi:MAG: SurA N-terminal domain-containing protein [Gammaproteobacteria bacterium]|nr:SurA N-terminal domain-containing protein [Gammaproteobacteria bacterium]